MLKKIYSLLIVLVFSHLLYAQDEVKIDLSKEYQTIDNFAASDCWSMQKIGAWALPQKERVADLLFSIDKGIGLSAWRFNIGGGINPYINDSWRTVETFEVEQGVYDWSRQEEERWFLQAAKERGVDQFIAFVNSPPGRMTRNGRTNCSDGLGSTNLKDGFEGQYATYLVDILKHFRDEWGITFNHISPVNEPQWEWNNSNQEGNRASNEDIKTIVEALYAEIQKQGIETEISLVESGDLQSWYEQRNDISSKYKEKYGNYLTDLFNDDRIKDKVAKHFGGHSYWSDLIGSELVQNRQALYSRMALYLKDGWKYWMTEYCVMVGPDGGGGNGRDLTIKTALDVARVIHYDLTIVQASAWQWWTAVSPENYKDGLIYTDYKNNPASQNIIESKTLWALGNYSRFIRPGSVRIKLAGANDKYGLLGSAYLNADRNKLIIVFLNMSESEKQIVITNSGLSTDKKIMSYTPYVTSNKSDDNLKEYPSFSADSSYTVPARSVVTLIGDIVETTGIHLFQGNFPNQYRLLQNFPNPFNSETIIRFNLPEASFVVIKIYNISGQEICTLTNDAFDAGYHSVNWDVQNNSGDKISSGIYICRIKAGKFTDSKKMSLLQ
jgi:hypothetical protein